MLARILIPLDGSTLAERALPIAARLIRASGGVMVLLQVYQAMPSEFTPELVVGSDTSDAREADAYLARVSQRAELAGIPVERVALGGAVAQTILDAVAAYQADTIVMTSHGRSGFTRRALGSVAEHVARHAPVPTLILCGEEIAPQAEEPVPSVIWRGYIGLDGSELAERALEPAARLLRALASASRAEASLLTVVHPATPEAAGRGEAWSRDQRLEQADAALRAAAARLETGDLAPYRVQARWAAVEATGTADALATAAEHPDRVHWRMSMEGKVDGAREEEVSALGVGEGTRFLALATRGSADLWRWALGGTVERVLEGSQLPLLIVPVVPA